MSQPSRLSRHAVQFYESDAELAQQVLRFLAPAHQAGEGVVAVVAPRHLPALRADLARLAPGATVLDAGEVVARLLANGHPSEEAFEREVGSVVRRLCRETGRVRAFGGTVALLCERGQGEAALELEGLWNRLLSQVPVHLLCAYPAGLFRKPGSEALFHDLCDSHLDVLPSAAGLPDAEAADPGRRVADLEQRLAALEERLADADEAARGGAELEDLIENAAECMHQVDSDGRILWANRAELVLLGYRREEYIGHTLQEFHADQEVLADKMERLRRGETVVNLPARLRCRDGSLRTVLLTANARFRGGKLLYTRCFTRDISDRLDLDAIRQGMQERQARRDGQHAALGRLARACREAASPQALLDEAAACVAAGLRLELCGVWRLEPGGAHAVLAAGTGWRASALGATREAAGDGTLFGEAILAGEPLVSDDLAKEDRFTVPRSLSGLTSGLAAPIEGGDGLAWGVLCAYTKERLNLSLDDAHFLQEASDLLGIGLLRASPSGERAGAQGANP